MSLHSFIERSAYDVGDVGRTNLFSANITLSMHWLVLLVKRLYGMLRLLNRGMAKKYQRDALAGGILFVTGSIPYVVEIPRLSIRLVNILSPWESLTQL